MEDWYQIAANTLDINDVREKMTSIKKSFDNYKVLNMKKHRCNTYLTYETMAILLY